jgi:hypothetical protein
MNVRSGPLDLEHNFTTITIVINKTSVIIISVYILWVVNIVINWCDFDGIIVIMLSVIIIIARVVGMNNIILFRIFLFLILCWLGEDAVK